MIVGVNTRNHTPPPSPHRTVRRRGLQAEAALSLLHVGVRRSRQGCRQSGLTPAASHHRDGPAVGSDRKYLSVLLIHMPLAGGLTSPLSHLQSSPENLPHREDSGLRPEAPTGSNFPANSGPLVVAVWGPTGACPARVHFQPQQESAAMD